MPAPRHPWGVIEDIEDISTRLPPHDNFREIPAPPRHQKRPRLITINSILLPLRNQGNSRIVAWKVHGGCKDGRHGETTRAVLSTEDRFLATAAARRGWTNRHFPEICRSAPFAPSGNSRGSKSLVKDSLPPPGGGCPAKAPVLMRVERQGYGKQPPQIHQGARGTPQRRRPAQSNATSRRVRPSHGPHHQPQRPPGAPQTHAR